MSFKDFEIIKEPVMFRGVAVAHVRGLALNDITVLVRGHLVEIDKLIAMFDNDATRETAMTEAARYAIKILQDAPDLAAKMIALASDEPDQADKIAKLPLPMQVESVRKIINLTFEEFGGAKKFIDSMLDLMGGFMPMMPEAVTV